MSNSNRIFTGSVSSCATKFLAVLFAVSFASSASWARRGGYVRGEQGQNSQQFDYGFQKCISGGVYVSNELALRSTQKMLHKAQVAAESSFPLVLRMNLLDEPFLSPGGKTGYAIATSTYLGCGILLTAAHNVALNPNPKDDFHVMNSDDVYGDFEKAELVGKVRDFRILPDFSAIFDKRKSSFKNTKEALASLWDDELAGVDLALLRVDDSLFQEKNPMIIAPEERIIYLPMESEVTFSGYGAQGLGERALGKLKMGDGKLVTSGSQPTAGSSRPGLVSRMTGVAARGDSGAAIFATELGPNQKYSSAQVAVFSSYDSKLQLNKVAYLSGPNRVALRAMWSDLTKGKNCSNPF